MWGTLGSHDLLAKIQGANNGDPKSRSSPKFHEDCQPTH